MLLNKTKVKAKSEQDKMDDGAQPADFRRQDKIGAQQRHRHLGKIEIELSSRANEECACQEFAKLPATLGEVERRQTEDDQCAEKCGDHIPLRLRVACASMMAFALATG